MTVARPRLTTSGVELAVADTGIGIPAEHLPHVFERFYRVDAARSAGGTGLGLAIARQIAEQHGGTLVAVSTPGRGSTFTLSLPNGETTEPAADPPVAADVSSSGHHLPPPPGSSSDPVGRSESERRS